MITIGQVKDIVLNDTHPKYQYVDDIGKIFVQLTDGATIDATPLDSNIKKYPLFNEFVNIYSFAGKNFYANTYNFLNNVSHNSIFTSGLSGYRDTNSERYRKNIASGNNQNKEKTNIDFGYGMFPDDTVRGLLLGMGDLSIEGRFGNTIRFGKVTSNDKNNPNMYIRVGQMDGVSDDFVIEDINSDRSSIWLTSDEEVNINPSTFESDKYLATAESKPTVFNGAQIIMNSDRLIFNTRQNEMLFFANAGISLGCNNSINMDMDKNFTIYAGQNIGFISDGGDIVFTTGGNCHHSGGELVATFSKILLGEKAQTIELSEGIIKLAGSRILIGKSDVEEIKLANGNEPMLMGKRTIKLLRKLIRAIIQLKVASASPGSPTSTPLNASSFLEIDAQLDTLLSQICKLK